MKIIAEASQSKTIKDEERMIEEEDVRSHYDAERFIKVLKLGIIYIIQGDPSLPRSSLSQDIKRLTMKPRHLSFLMWKPWRIKKPPRNASL